MEKKNTGLIVLVIILFILVLGLGGFIVYDKCLNKKNNEIVDNKNNNTNNDNSAIKNNLIKRQQLQWVYGAGQYSRVYVDVDGSAYVTVYPENVYNDNATKNSLLKFQSRCKSYTLKGESFRDGGDFTISAYKFDHIMTAYYIHDYASTSGKTDIFVFIKDDRTLSYFYVSDLYKKGEVNIKNVNNLKDIVSVVENNYKNIPYAITKDGTEISLKDYIK